MLIKIETGQPWEPPEPINEVRYPLNIEALWTDEELAAIGLARHAPPSPPDPPEPPPEGE